MTTTETTMHVGAERAPFVMLPRWLLHDPGVSDGAKVLYCVLHDLVAGREGPTRPVTRGQLAACCAVSVDTVDRRLAELTNAGAVEKQAQFDTGHGQLANVYWVRLSPPAAHPRPPVDNPPGPGRASAAPPAADPRPPQPHGGGDPDRADAAPIEEQDQERPPQPPRRAGGRNVPNSSGSPRAAGANPRALRANPRADDDTTEAARRRAEADAHTAAVDAETARRRAEADAASAAVAAAEAEALALSAALDDTRLAAVAAHVAARLPGPLARSPLALSRTILAWSRAATIRRPGPLVDAVDTAVAAAWHPPAGEEPPPGRLDLPPPTPGTRPLRDRLAELLRGETVAT